MAVLLTRILTALENAEQAEKAEILKFLLTDYNDGRKKTLFCVAVNLLELQEIKEILIQIKSNSELDRFTLKEKSAYVAGLFQNAAKQKSMELKLRRKK